MSAVDWYFTVRDYITYSGRKVVLESGWKLDIAVDYASCIYCTQN